MCFRLEYEQSRLLNRMEELVSTFDAELRILRHQKFKLDIVMKNADLRLVGSLRLRSVSDALRCEKQVPKSRQ